MKAKLDHTDWGEILGTSTINHQWLGFKEYFKKIQDEFIPHRLVSNINRHKGKVPSNKESVKKIMKNTMETLHGEKRREYYIEYCNVKNQVRKLTRRIQKEFEMKLAKEAKTNPKAVLKYMNPNIFSSNCHDTVCLKKFITESIITPTCFFNSISPNLWAVLSVFRL